MNLDAVTFIGSTGLTALVEGYHTAVALGIGYQLGQASLRLDATSEFGDDWWRFVGTIGHESELLGRVPARPRRCLQSPPGHWLNSGEVNTSRSLCQVIGPAVHGLTHAASDVPNPVNLWATRLGATSCPHPCFG
jgi:hypothetical protein